MAKRRPSTAGIPPLVTMDRGPAAARNIWACIALIAVVTACIYVPCLRGGFILDDKIYVSESSLVSAADGLQRFWLSGDAIDYWPVTNTSFWIEWRLWERNTTGYHVTNLVLHIATALLLWATLARLGIPGAFLAGLLFAVHPVNVESVAWITQRKNLLALFFSLVATLSYLRAEQRAGSPVTGRWYWLSLVAFVMAMLSKGSVAVWPLVLLSLIWWQRPLTQRDLLRTIPFWLVGGALTLVNIAFQARVTISRDVGFVDRLLGAVTAVWFYLYKALLPIGLCFVYPQWTIRPDQLRWWLPLLAAITVTALLWHFRQRWSRPLWLAWFVFVITLVPVMGFTDVGFMEHSLVADHYQHIALIAVVALVAAAWDKWRQRTATDSRWAPLAVATAVVVALATLTWRESALYADPIVLYQTSLARNPDSAFAANNLGLELLDVDRKPEAIEAFRRAVQLKANYPEAYYNLGRVFTDLGQPGDALTNYQQAVRLRPTFAGYQRDLGTALIRAQQPTEAIEHLQEALRLQPDFPEAENDLGGVLLETGRLDDAIAHFEQALRARSEFAEAHANLGKALLQAQRPQDAVAHLEAAARLRPDSPDAHNDLAVALAGANRNPEAIAQLETALRLKPDHANARANLDELRATAAQ